LGSMKSHLMCVQLEVLSGLKFLFFFGNNDRCIISRQDVGWKIVLTRFASGAERAKTMLKPRLRLVGSLWSGLPREILASFPEDAKN
jgi:hypothetical protein